MAGALAAAWAYLLLGAGSDMEGMDKGDGQMMTMLPEWSLPYAVLIFFVMWGAMMVAMMLPTAAPTVLLV